MSDAAGAEIPLLSAAIFRSGRDPPGREICRYDCDGPAGLNGGVNRLDIEPRRCRLTSTLGLTTPRPTRDTTGLSQRRSPSAHRSARRTGQSVHSCRSSSFVDAKRMVGLRDGASRSAAITSTSPAILSPSLCGRSTLRATRMRSWPRLARRSRWMAPMPDEASVTSAKPLACCHLSVS
jgi:hypothetical protein